MKQRRYLVRKHLLQHPGDLNARRVPHEMNRMVFIPRRIVACTPIDGEEWINGMELETWFIEKSLE